MTPRSTRCRRTAFLVVAAAAALAAFAAASGSGQAVRPTVSSGNPPAPALATFERGAEGPRRSVETPGPLRVDPVVPRLMVVSEHSLPVSLLRRVRAVPDVRAAVPMSLASLPVAGRTITLAAADPAAYRRFVPARGARARDVWVRAAAGDLVLESTLATEIGQPLGGDLALSDRPGGVSLRVGAFSPMPASVDAFVNGRRGAQLGMTSYNAMLVAVSPARVREANRVLDELLGHRATVYPLVQPPAADDTPSTSTPGGPPARGGAAVLSGGSVAQAAGSFRYRYFPDGTVRPDPRWVAANIRTEAVPILGTVTCHRVMLPRLRWALQELVDRGLASAIDAGDFGGCYVPRFIGYDPANGLSLHTWGIAVDLNVSSNQRGTAGQIDPAVVEVFKKWGFAWGGDWTYTDPMHFELAVLTRPMSSS